MRQNIKFLRTIHRLVLVLFVLGFWTQIDAAQKKVTSPEEFFGFELGSDKKIARWDKIVDYYRLLEKESDKLKVTFDNNHPLAYGMPSEGLVLFRSSMVFDITPGQQNENYKTVVRYINRDILQIGWLIGEEHLSNKAAMVSAKYGKSQVVLIGFRTQHRSQTHGTFKLLFNALIR